MTKSEFLSELELCPLKAEDIHTAKCLCDECVGKDMYSQEDIGNCIDSAYRFFYLLKEKNGGAVGYLYFYVTDVQQIAEDGKVDIRLLRTVCPVRTGVVGKIQSIGLKEHYRKNGYGKYMIDFAVQKFRALDVNRVVIICWKKGDDVPLGNTLDQCHFQFLTTAKMVWFDHPRLYCPYCAGRCRCDAQIYYKILD